MPTMIQAGVYSATTHYLKAVRALGSKEPLKAMAEMREMPINDFMTRGGNCGSTDGFCEICIYWRSKSLTNPTVAGI
jgi:hypothetical protein